MIPLPAGPIRLIRDESPPGSLSKQHDSIRTLNAASQVFAARYYPKPNLNVAEGVLPNIASAVPTTIKSDVFGFRLDHQFTPNDTVFRA